GAIGYPGRPQSRSGDCLRTGTDSPSSRCRVSNQADRTSCDGSLTCVTIPRGSRHHAALPRDPELSFQPSRLLLGGMPGGQTQSATDEISDSAVSPWIDGCRGVRETRLARVYLRE